MSLSNTHTLLYYHALLERHVHRRRRRAGVLIRPIICRDVRGRPRTGPRQARPVQRHAEAWSIWEVYAAVRGQRLIEKQPAEVGNDGVAPRRPVWK